MIAPYFLENFWVGSAFNLCLLHQYYGLMFLSRCSVPIIFVSAGKATVIDCGGSRLLRSCCDDSGARFRHNCHAHRPLLIFHGDYYFATLGFGASVKPSTMKRFRNPPLSW